jgi:hypothetical protein
MKTTFVSREFAARLLDVTVAHVSSLVAAGRLSTNGTGEKLDMASVRRYADTRIPGKSRGGKNSHRGDNKVKVVVKTEKVANPLVSHCKLALASVRQGLTTPRVALDYIEKVIKDLK